jgi:hypothetical protein
MKIFFLTLQVLICSNLILSQIRGFDVLMYVSELQNQSISFINDSPFKTQNKELSFDYFSNNFPSTKEFLDSVVVETIIERSEMINRNILSSLNSVEVDFEKISRNINSKDSLYENRIRGSMGYDTKIPFHKILDTLHSLNIYDSIHRLVSTDELFFKNPQFYIFINKLYIVNDDFILLHYIKHSSQNLSKFFRGGCVILKYNQSINSFRLLAFEESWHR